MSRLSALLVAAGLAAGTVGCAQCDTCDDFPAPCVGPNCGGAYGTGPVAGPAPTLFAAPSATPGPGAPASLAPANDSAGPAPSMKPADAPVESTPARDGASPPRPTDPSARPGR